MQLPGIATQLGNEILEWLVITEWHMQRQGQQQREEVLAIVIELTKESDQVIFEWDNCQEWTISGPKDILLVIVDKYALADSHKVLQ